METTGISTLNDTKFSADAHDRKLSIKPSETEVAQLIQEALQQYEECMRLADLSDIYDSPEITNPRYAWDNPIGLVVTEPLNAKLV